MADDKVKATLYLPESVHRRLKVRAAENRSSMTELVVEAIEDLLERPPGAFRLPADPTPHVDAVAPRDDIAPGPPLLQRVWRAVEGLPTLASVADIRNGIDDRGSVRNGRDRMVSAEARDGFQPGITRVSDGFEPLVVRAYLYLAADPAAVDERPKVIVNAARLGRGPWVVSAAPDWTGLVLSHRFQALRPTGALPIEVLAAIVNGPVANAFMSVNRTTRDNRIDTLERVPIPRFDAGSIAAIRGAVAAYRQARLEWLDQPLAQGAFEERCRATLDQIDAHLLTAYDLPPRVERELLDYFAGFRRPGPVGFDRYYPDDFRPALPWWLFVSGDVRRAGAKQTLERLPVLRDSAFQRWSPSWSKLATASRTANNCCALLSAHPRHVERYACSRESCRGLPVEAFLDA